MSDHQTPNDTIMLQLGRLEGKVDSLLRSRDKLEDSHQAIETRVQFLENSRARVMGAAAVLGTLGGVVATTVEFLLRK